MYVHMYVCTSTVVTYNKLYLIKDIKLKHRDDIFFFFFLFGVWFYFPPQLKLSYLLI